MSANEQYIASLIVKTKQGTEKGMRRAVIFAQAEAQKLAVNRIYKHPVYGDYVRTGLYKASIKGSLTKIGTSKIDGQLQSPVEYANWLEYRCRYMCLTDAVMNNRDKILRYIREETVKGGSSK